MMGAVSGVSYSNLKSKTVLGMDRMISFLLKTPLSKFFFLRS